MDVLVRVPASASPLEPTSIPVREAVDADWLECGRICYEAFATVATRHGFPIDFPSVEAASLPIRWLINHPHIHGVVAERDGRILGSSFLDERSMISAIGPVSVDPTVQDSGVGRALMEAVVREAGASGASVSVSCAPPLTLTVSGRCVTIGHRRGRRQALASAVDAVSTSCNDAPASQACHGHTAPAPPA